MYFPDIVRLSIPFFFVLLVLFFAAGVSYYIYKRTVPEIGSKLKTLLFILRITALFFLIILLLKPDLFTLYFKENPKKINLYIDNSESMNWTSENEQRLFLRDSLRQVLFNTLKDSDSEIIMNYFADSVYNYSPEGTTAEGGTNFESLFKKISETPGDYNIILSDGIRTEGSIPFNSGSSVLYTVGFGQTSLQKDLFISKVNYSPVVFAGKKQKIKVDIGSQLYENVQFNVSLFVDGRLKNVQQARIVAFNSELSVEFEYTYERTGQAISEIKIDPLKGEVNLQNNTFTFAQQFLKSKLRVGIFSGKPNYEHKFLKLLLQKNEDFSVHSYVKIRNTWTDNLPVDSLDIFVLCGFPAKNSTSEIWNRIKTLSDNANRPFLLFLNNSTDIAKINEWISKISNVGITPLEKDLSVTVDAGAASLSPALNVFREAELNMNFWSNISPINVSLQVKTDNEKNILLSGRSLSYSLPLIVKDGNENPNSVIFNGEGFWRWYFLNSADDDINKGYPQLLTNVIRMLSASEKTARVKLQAEKDVLYRGEKVNLQCFVYDAQNLPLSEADLRIEVISDSATFEIIPVFDSTLSSYSADFFPSAQGKYRLKAKAYLNGNLYGESSQTISVIPYKKEFLSIYQDTLFLKQIAAKNKGRYFNAENLDSLTAYMDLEPEIKKESSRIFLYFEPVLLFLILGFFVLEWIIRKRNNLA